MYFCFASDTQTALRNTPDLQEKITNRLKELGETQKAEQVGELISRYAQGEKLTKKERHLMASSKPSLQVVVEAKNGRFSLPPNRTATTISPDNMTTEERHAYRMWVDDVINRRNNAVLEKILSIDFNGMTREQLHANREFVDSEIYKTSNFKPYSQLRRYREKVDAEIAEMERNSTFNEEASDSATNNAIAMESMNLHEYRQMVDAEMQQMGIAPADEYNGQYSQSVVPMVGDIANSTDVKNTTMQFDNMFADSVNGDTINHVEMFKKSDDTRHGFKFISNKHFDTLTIEARKLGATIVRGSPEVEAHLDKQRASAATFGDILLFKQDVCVSEVLEETYHFKQNIQGINNDKSEPLRTILNEIDAKQFIVDNANRYKVPRVEVELLRKQIESYKMELTIYMGENIDEKDYR